MATTNEASGIGPLVERLRWLGYDTTEEAGAILINRPGSDLLAVIDDKGCLFQSVDTVSVAKAERILRILAEPDPPEMTFLEFVEGIAIVLDVQSQVYGYEKEAIFMLEGVLVHLRQPSIGTISIEFGPPDLGDHRLREYRHTNAFAKRQALTVVPSKSLVQPVADCVNFRVRQILAVSANGGNEPDLDPETKAQADQWRAQFP